MSQLTVQTIPAIAPMTADQVELIKKLIAKDATDDELKLFMYQCERSGLDPLSKQIYFQKRNGKMVIITAIDGYRLIADRTGNYAGSDDSVFNDESDPRKATVTVWKFVAGIRCPFTASARWSEYYPGDVQGQMWRKMPCTMLAKCAEALALRKAFPKELSGLYVKEEMDQADNQNAPLPTLPNRPELTEGSLGNTLVGGGLFKGKKLRDIPKPDLLSYINHWSKKEKEGEQLSDSMVGLLETMRKYLNAEDELPPVPEDM